MGTYVYKSPSGQSINFNIKGNSPSQTEMERINSFVAGNWEGPAKAPAKTPEVATEDEPGIWGAVGSGIAAGWNQIQGGVNDMGAGLAAANGGSFGGYSQGDWLNAAAAQEKEAQSYWAPKNDFTAEPGLYNKARNLAYQFGVSAPAMGAGIGAALLAPASVPAALTTGAVVSGAAALPQIFGENVQAQQDQNKGNVKDWGKVWASSGVNAAIEGISDRVTFGLAGILTPVVAKAARPLVSEAAKAAAAKVFPELARKVGVAAAGSAITGAMEEATQAAVTRWNAEQPLGDAAAQKDYLENAIVGGLLQGGMALGLSPLTARSEIKQREHFQSWDDAHKDGAKWAASKNALYEEATKAPPPPAPEFIPALEDHSGPSTEQRFLKEKPISMAGIANIERNREPVEEAPKRSKVTEEEYRSVVDGLRDAGMISPGKIRTTFGFNDKKSHTVMEMLKERGDVREAGDSQSRYYKIKSGEQGTRTPDRKIRVGEYDAQNKTPYTLRKSDGSQIGNNSFKTQEEAHKWAVESGVAGKVPFTVERTKDPTAGFAVYEDSFKDKKLSDGTTENVKVGVKTVGVYPDAKSANLAAKELDPNFSPETNEIQAETPRQKYISQLKQGAAGEIQKGLDNVFGEGRIQFTLKDGVLTAADTGDVNTPKMIEGFMNTVHDPDGRVKGILQASAAMLDRNNPDLDLRGIAEGHELGHFIVGTLNKNEVGQLVNLANTMKVPGKTYTWTQQEVARHSDENGNVNTNPEEVIVQMLRGYIENPQAFDKKQRSTLQKVVDLLRKLLGMSGNDGRDLLDAIYNRGILKDREFNSGDARDLLKTNGNTFFSTIPVSGFYMKSAKVLDAAKQDSASPEQWMGMLKNAGVKPDELDWLGLEDAMKSYLRHTDKRSVPKEEIINYIKANSLEVNEWTGDTKDRRNSNLIGAAQYAAAVQPDGEDYTEMVFSLPRNRMASPGDDMPGRHFQNVSSTYWNQLAHTRFTTRNIDGHRALFIEEIQSDWHQAGQMRGYKNTDHQIREKEASREHREAGRSVDDLERAHFEITQQLYKNPNLTQQEKETLAAQDIKILRSLKEAKQRLDAAKKVLRKLYDAVPDAPLKSNWDEFVMKRLIRYAAENDFDYIAWHGEPDSVAHTEGYQDWEQEDTPDGPKYYLKFHDQRETNLTSIFNRYLAPQGLRAVGKKLGKKFGSVPFLYDPAKAPTPGTSKAYFNNVDDIGSLSVQFEPDNPIVKKLNLLEQLVYQNHGMDDITDAEAISYQNKVGLSNVELERWARATQGSENDPAFYRRWMMEIPKDMKESALGEGFPMFSAVTQTPHFQKWFEGSKVHDRQGKPMVMYHGTSKDVIFNKFKTGRRGAWFTTEPWEASMYASDNDSRGYKRDGWDMVKTNTKDRVIPVYLNIKNPYELTEAEQNRLIQSTNYAKTQGDIFDVARSRGFDGVRMEGFDNGHEVWVAFEPTQIKSIFNTEFLSSDPKFSAITKTPHFQKWFGESKLVNRNGDPIVLYHGTAASFDRFGRTQVTDFGFYGNGFYFTPDIMDANSYVGMSDYKFPRDESRPRIIPAYISIKNPYIFRIGEDHKPNNAAEADAFTNRLKSLGHDGIVVPYDYLSPIEDASDIYEVVAFDPTQIKSIWNQDFDPTDPRYSAIPRYSSAVGNRLNPVPAVDIMRQVEQQQTYDNLAAGINSIINRIPFIKDTTKYKARQFVDGSVINLQDRMLPLGRLIDRVKKNGGVLSNDTDTYLQHTLMSGQTQYNLEQTEKNFFRPLHDAVKAVNISDEDWRNLRTLNAAAIEFLRDQTDKRYGTAELYLYAQHAQERNALMFDRNVGTELRNEQAEAGSGMTNEEAAQILHFVNTRPDLRNNLSSLANPNSVRSRMRALIAHTNDVRLEAGLSPDFGLIQLEDGKEMPHFDDYVPLRGFAIEHPDGDKEAQDFARGGKGYKIRGKEDKSALGRRSMGTELVAHAMLQSSEAVVRAGKNKVAMSFVNMVRENADELRDIAEIVHVAPMKWALDSNSGKVRRVFNQQFANRDDILIGKEDGKEIMVQIHDDKVAKSLLTRPNMGNGSLAKVGDAMLSVNRFLAAMRTAYSPEFMLSNFLRDLQAATLNMSELEVSGLRSEVMSNLPKALAGAREVIRKETSDSEWGKAFVDFQKAGGQTAYMGLTDLKDMIEKVNKHIEDGNNLSNVMKGFNALKDWVEDYNTVIENGVRLSAFNTLRNRFANGSTDPKVIRRANERAAFISKNLTVNFNAGGELKPLMNAMYLFYNASMQGTLALINPLVRSPKVRKMWMGVILAGLAQDLLMSMISPEDDDGQKIYDKIPDYISDNKMIFVDPFGFTDRGYFAFPMPYLMNSIYGIGRHMGRVIRGKEAPMEASKNMVFDLANSVNPWGQSNTFLNWVAPTLMDPIVDLAVNSDAFGKPIAKEGSPFGLDEKASARYWNNTSQPYIKMADWLSRISGSDGAYMPGAIEVSPNQIGYVMDFLGGAVWSFADRVARATVPGYGDTTIFDMVTGSDFSANDVPFARVFFGNISDREDTQSYITKRDEVLRVRKSLKEAAEAGDSQRYQELMRNYPNEYRLSAKINALENQRRKLARRLNKVRESDKLSATRKAELEDTIKEQQNEIIAKANRILGDV